MKNKNKEKYLEKIYKNYQGCYFKVIKYDNKKEITIQFLDKYKHIKVVQLIQVIKKNIKNPYIPSVCGVGFIGDMEKKIGGRERKIKEYKTWHSMLERCYGKSNRNTTYKNCYVCQKWLNFSNFYKWIKLQSNYKQWKEKNIGV